MASNTAANQVYNFLVGKDLDPEVQKVPDPVDPDSTPNTLLTFDFIGPSGHNYGTAVILLGDSMEMFFGDNLGRTMEGDDKQAWYDFLYALRNIARRNMMTYDWKDLAKLKHNLRGQANISEAIFESLSGNRTRSWSAPPNEVRMVIHHSRPLEENDKRYRNIDKIFIETDEGERYRLPFRSLRGAKAMLEHVRQGGRPYDLRGNHIAEMVSELNVLSKFKRANHGKIFEGDMVNIMERTERYFTETKKTLDHISSTRGYTRYFESWNPSELTNDEIMVEDLRNMFIETRLDQRIESALPILAKLQKEDVMKEAAEFEKYISNIAEGTWAIPDTPALKDKLKELLKNPLPVGIDALNATEQLYDILGDDELFDQLTDLAEEDPEADARDLIIARMQELDSALDINQLMGEPDDDTDIEEPAPEPTPEPAAEPPPPPPAPVPQPVQPAPQPAMAAPAVPPMPGQYPPIQETSDDIDITDPKEVGAKMNKAYVSPAARASMKANPDAAAPAPSKIGVKTSPVPDVKLEDIERIKNLVSFLNR